MGITPTAAAAASLMLLSACAGGDFRNESSAPTQWKEVTRMQNGTFITYRVPVNQPVPPGTQVRKFDASASNSSTPVAAAASPAVTPVAGAPDRVRPAAPPAGDAVISKDAEGAMRRAETIVKNLRTRSDAALAELELARQAAERGDSASVMRHSSAATQLTRPDD